MTKDELKEKIKSIAKQTYKPVEKIDLDAPVDNISFDSVRFPVLLKFPKLLNIIIELLTDQYDLFLNDIEWIAPKPTTFRITLGNNEQFSLIFTERSWIAKVEGKKYYLLNVSEKEQSTEAIARLLSYGNISSKTEETPPEESTSKETPTPEEPTKLKPTEKK